MYGTLNIYFSVLQLHCWYTTYILVLCDDWLKIFYAIMTTLESCATFVMYSCMLRFTKHCKDTIQERL